MSIWDKKNINIQSEGMIFSENYCKIMPSSISNRSSQVWSSCRFPSPFSLFCLLYLAKAVDVLPCLAGTEPQASNTMTVGKRERNPGIVSILKVQERSCAYPRVESNNICKPIIQLAPVHSSDATHFSVGIRTARP